MATSEVDIYNMALSQLGTFSSLVSPSDNRREAELCRTWYDNCRRRILRSAPWGEALAFRRLSLTAERDNDADWVSTNPAPGWLFAYSVPNDFLWPRFISDFRKFGFYGTSITTNSESPIIAYTKDETNVSRFNPDLERAIAFDLAAHIAPGLTNLNAQPAMFQMAQSVLDDAKAAALNEMNEVLETIPEWIAVRGFTGAAPQTPFLWPSAEYMPTGFNNLG